MVFGRRNYGALYARRAGSTWVAIFKRRTVQPAFHHAWNHYVVDVRDTVIRWLCQ
jgi:hypothetical protein